jgi:hypothetical protein
MTPPEVYFFLLIFNTKIAGKTSEIQMTHSRNECSIIKENTKNMSVSLIVVTVSNGYSQLCDSKQTQEHSKGVSEISMEKYNKKFLS